MITTNVFGVRIFRKFTVYFCRKYYFEKNNIFTANILHAHSVLTICMWTRRCDTWSGGLLFDSQCLAHGFLPIPSKQIKPDIQNIHGPLTYHVSYCYRPSRILLTEKRYWARISENQYLYEKLHAFYSTILMSCYRHDDNNVKECWNSGDLAPKILIL